MRRTVAPILLALACAAALAGCTLTRTGDDRLGATAGGLGSRDAGDTLVPELRVFTEELASKVESAQDAKAGVAEAQRLLDARKAEMAARIAAYKRSPRMQEPSARGAWLEAEVDNTQRVRQLRLKYVDASMRDPELKARLDRLVADYDALFSDR